MRDLCYYLLINVVVILVFRINICAFHLAMGCTFYYDFSSVIIIVVVVDGVVVVVVGMVGMCVC